MKHLLSTVMLVAVASAQSFLEGPQQASTSCPCGWGVKGRIVGGKEAERNAYAFMTGLTGKNGIPFCGAAILTTQHAITAAHCTADRKNRISELRLLVGAHDVRQTSSSQYHAVKSTVEHENYDSESDYNDIALIVLEKPLTFTQQVGPICLPPRKTNLVGYKVRVAGWGLTLNEGSPSRKLLEVDLRVIPWEVCKTHYTQLLQNDRSQFCTFEWNKDSCQGDSGGPLFAIDPEINRYVLVGLVSFGRECASHSPAVNTDVGHFLPWIRSKIAATSTGLQTCAKVTSPFRL